MRTFNVRFFLISLATVIGVAGIVFGIHYLQTGRIARALLWQADRARQEDAAADAAKYLRRYLEFEPQDQDRRAELGQLLAGEKLATTHRARSDALFVLEPIITRDPERHDLRRLVVRLAMAPPRPRLKVAKEHLEILHKKYPDDGEVAHLLGACWEAERDNPRAPEIAASYYTLAVQKSPDHLDSYVRLSALYRGSLQQSEQADQTMNNMVSANRESPRAHLFRGEYRLKHGSTDEGAEDIARAAALAPDDVDTILAATEVALSKKNWDMGRAALDRGLANHPKEPRLYSARARLEVMSEKPDEAVSCLRNGIRVLTGSAQADLHWTLINILLDQTDPTKLKEAEALVAQLERTGSSAVPYLQARLLHRKEEWNAAARLFERSRMVLDGDPVSNKDLLTQVDLHLGECYGQLREPARQMEAYRRALARDSNSVPAYVGLATAYRALGQVDEAVKLYDQMGKLNVTPDTDAAYWIDMAQLRIEQNLQQRNPDWRGVETALAHVEKSKPDGQEAVLLRAHLLVAQNKFVEAQELLVKAKDRDPEQLEFWTALVAVACRRGEWKDAESFLEHAEQQHGDSVESRLARARYWSARRGPEAVAAVTQLSNNLDKFSAEQQARLLSGLGATASQLGETALAERIWKQLIQHPQQQHDPRLRMLLFEIALSKGNDAETRAALDEIKKIEGENGDYARYAKALFLIRQSERKLDKDTLNEARQILDQLASQRPSWPAIPLAKAELDRLQKRPELAIAHYRKAIELGDRSARAVRPLVLLLYQAHRYSEANQEIQRLQKDILTKEMKQIAAMVSLRTNNPESALELAQGAVSGASNDYRDHLWLGHVMAASGRHAEAEQNLRRAVELGETHAETWVSLVQFLARRDPDAAEKVTEQARAKLPKDQASLALAQCVEAIGRRDEALKFYQAALNASPHDLRTIRSVVTYYIKAGRTADAEPLLRRVMKQTGASESDTAWARRSLAIVLGSRGHFKSYQEALALVGLRLDDTNRIVETAMKPSDDGTEEQRARACVLASHSLGRTKAVSLLEDLGRRQMQTADDQFLLMQLYESEGAWSRAADVLRSLIAEHGQQPLYVAYYAQNLLRSGKLADAETAIRALEDLEKARNAPSGTLGTVELRVQLHKAQGQDDRAIALLKQHLARKDARPDELFVLIGYLSRANRLNEALDLCEQAWKTCAPEAVGGASINVLKSTKPSDADYLRVERWLKAALEQKPKSTPLLMHLADLQGQRGKYQEEEQLYESVLKLEPHNIVAMNNRAWLMALRTGDGSAARPLIENALELLGPRAELLDTRAMVHLAMGDSAKAIADLQKAVSLDAPTASRYFHLARAYHMANNRDAAINAYRKAKELGLDRNKLHPVERMACGKLLDEMERR